MISDEIKTVLVVDDEELNISILVELLSCDYDVVIALDGATVIQIVEEECVDLILLDIMMPEMNGYEVCEYLKSKKNTKNIPIIFTTAVTDENSIEKAYDVGAVDYVMKPFKPKELLSRLKIQLNMQTLIDNLKDSKNELKELNNSLEEKIKQEVEKNRKKEKQLLNQSRLAQMGEMISMIAHQWRQPLGAISSAIIAIEMNIASGRFNNYKDLVGFLDKKHKNINEYVQFLSTTIDDFRSFFKPDKSKELVNLTVPIVKALSIVEISMKNKGIKISTDYQDNDELEIYQNEVVQVILNILKNSEDNFIERDISNPVIEITTKKQHNKLIIKISDNGKGIEENILPKIFDPYFSIKSEKNGTGLGLYMSKVIIEEHNNGELNVQNHPNGVAFDIVFHLDS